MHEAEFPRTREMWDLEGQYRCIWAGLAEATTMPRELEAVGGMVVQIILGHGCAGVAGPSDENGDYFLPNADHLDHEPLMLFSAGKLAMSWMCGTSPGKLPLSLFSTRLVANIAREFLGNLGEILRLAWKLREEGFLADADLNGWNSSGVGEMGAGHDPVWHGEEPKE